MNDLDRLMQKLDRMQESITRIDKKVNYTIQRVCVLEEPATPPPYDHMGERLKELIREVRDVNLLNNGRALNRVKPAWLDEIEKEFSL